jgi:hypothetical protein
MAALETVEQMHGKNFAIYIVNVDKQPEIKLALSCKDRAEFISIKEKKIHNRKAGIIFSNEILELLK